MLHAPNPEGGPDMRLPKQTLVLVGAAALLFGASVASADDPSPYPACTNQPSKEDTEAAKGLHQIATSRLSLQDYDKAIEFWKQAYALDCTAHPILQNIASAYELKGDKKSAIVALETYLVRSPNASDLIKVNEHVIELKKSLEPAPPVTATATVSAAPTVTATAAPTTTAAPTGPRPFGNTPLLVAGVGGVLALAGAIMIPVGVGPYNHAIDVCGTEANPTGTCPKDVADAGSAGRVTANLGFGFLGLGVAAAAGGLAWHFVWNKPKPLASNGTPAAPSASPASSGAPTAPPASSPPSPNAAPQPAPKAQIDIAPIVGTTFSGLSVSGRF